MYCIQLTQQLHGSNRCFTIGSKVFVIVTSPTVNMTSIFIVMSPKYVPDIRLHPDVISLLYYSYTSHVIVTSPNCKLDISHHHDSRRHKIIIATLKIIGTSPNLKIHTYTPTHRRKPYVSYLASL